MKCQILFSGINKKNNIILSSAENAQRVVKVKDKRCVCHDYLINLAWLINLIHSVYSFVEIDHEIFSTIIVSLPLIQEGPLSVSGETICTILVNSLED